MLDNIPFYWRVIALLGLMAIVGTIDRMRYGSKATRFQEYGFIVLTGLMGCGVALCCDWLTSTLSPEYFIIGKGLPEDNYTQNVCLFASKTGFSGGIIAGAVVIFALGKRRPAWTTLLQRLWVPVACAFAAGALMAALAPHTDPLGYSRQLSGALDARQLRLFQIVWWTHTGLYLGLILGVVELIRRCRTAASTATIAPLNTPIPAKE
jgi:hypothetical protein